MADSRKEVSLLTIVPLPLALSSRSVVNEVRRFSCKLCNTAARDGGCCLILASRDITGVAVMKHHKRLSPLNFSNISITALMLWHSSIICSTSHHSSCHSSCLATAMLV